METITLKRIAGVLNLSISTVSRALKNHADISAETKRRVHELAETLDYEPNINAVSLRSKKNMLLGLILPSVSGFFYDSFISAVEEECSLNGYMLIVLQTSNDAQKEINSLKICRQNRMSGVFVCLSAQTSSMSAFDKFREAEIPLVFFDKVPDDNKYNKVCTDDEESAKLAAELILSKNKKNILAIFGDENLSITKIRFKAFQKIVALQKEVIIHNEFCSSSKNAREVSQKYFHSKIKIKPDAVFCMSDEILIGVMKTLQLHQIKIPENTSILTMSDGFLPKIYTPEITYIETSGYKLGKLAFTKMLNCVNGINDVNEVFTRSILVDGKTL